jgi:transposase
LNLVYKGRLVSEVGQALGIGENLIYKWKRRAVGREKPPLEVKGVTWSR